MGILGRTRRGRKPTDLWGWNTYRKYGMPTWFRRTFHANQYLYSGGKTYKVTRYKR